MKIKIPVEILGTMSDPEIAKKFNVSATAIYHRRKKLGIKPYSPQPNKTSIKWSKIPLGKVSDRKIAEKYNVSSTTINNYRLKNNIVASNKIIDWNNVGLGKEKDSDIARDYNVSNYTVWYNRVKRGITKYKIGEEKC